jgi:hypothetical protein
MRIRPSFILLVLVAGLALAPSAFAANEIAYECDLDICLLDHRTRSTSC